MKYCARCGSEYQDSVNACADCPGNPLLVSAEEMRSRGLPLPHELDTRIFVRAGSAEDPFTAEVYAQLLQDANIPVLVRAGRSGVVDKLTTGNVLPWWEIHVPADQQVRAATLIEQERLRELATNDEAAAAAEAEERETESPAAEAEERETESPAAPPPAY
ncbi:DUF2007 domain-containing protein [Myxococcus xanthus]|uniref:DUF2007 domain-containing protein n=1 Tax=Myxococcus xanthus TaxID=34 RepID=UPI001916DBDD|nr:DUF2007 domain-containing protein [Myxococcus xanthus]QQR42567.1 DUF2007 domain-containing protein [Myxococcus xanthus]